MQQALDQGKPSDRLDTALKANPMTKELLRINHGSSAQARAAVMQDPEGRNHKAKPLPESHGSTHDGTDPVVDGCSLDLIEARSKLKLQIWIDRIGDQ